MMENAPFELIKTETDGIRTAMYLVQAPGSTISKDRLNRLTTDQKRIARRDATGRFFRVVVIGVCIIYINDEPVQRQQKA
jgi:hypothetical protein